MRQPATSHPGGIVEHGGIDRRLNDSKRRPPGLTSTLGMSNLFEYARQRITHPEKKKFVKYSAVSVISLLITQVLYFILTYFFEEKGGRSQLIASSIAAVPAFYLNKMWVWRISNRDRVQKEVALFWFTVFAGLGFVSLMSMLTDIWIHNSDFSRMARAWILQLVSVGSYGALWVGKFFFLNKLTFIQK